MLREQNSGVLPGYKPGDKCATCHRGGTLPFDDDPTLVLENATPRGQEMIKDGIWCAFGDYHMGITAENVAERFNVGREEQDRIGYRSQQLAKKAIDAGLFKEEIVPVEIKTKKGVTVFDTDEHPRPDSTLEAMAKLPGAFKKDGTVTAGNASGINDAGACLVLASREWAEKNGKKILATVVAHAAAGLDPAIMGMGTGSYKHLKLPMTHSV